MDSVGLMICELQVDTQSPGWHKTLMKVLTSIQGVTFTIDAELGIARVSGQVDPGKLLLMLEKAGKHADLLWVDSGNHYKNIMPTTGQRDVQMMHNNLSMMPANGYGYYVIDPQSRYLYSQYQNYPQYHPEYYPYSQNQNYPQYYPEYYPYFEPQAKYFPQAPPPMKNPRLQSLCNMM